MAARLAADGSSSASTSTARATASSAASSSSQRSQASAASTSSAPSSRGGSAPAVARTTAADSHTTAGSAALVRRARRPARASTWATSASGTRLPAPTTSHTQRSSAPSPRGASRAADHGVQRPPVGLVDRPLDRLGYQRVAHVPSAGGRQRSNPAATAGQRGRAHPGRPRRGRHDPTPRRRPPPRRGPPGRRRGAHHPFLEEVDDVRRHGDRARRPPAVRTLLDDACVTELPHHRVDRRQPHAGAGGQVLDEGRRHGSTQPVGGDRGDGVRAERTELDPHGHRQPSQPPDHVADVGPCRRCSGPARRHQDDPFARQLRHQVVEHLEGHAVGPVQVVDHERPRATPRRGGRAAGRPPARASTARRRGRHRPAVSRAPGSARPRLSRPSTRRSRSAGPTSRRWRPRAAAIGP